MTAHFVLFIEYDGDDHFNYVSVHKGLAEAKTALRAYAEDHLAEYGEAPKTRDRELITQLYEYSLSARLFECRTGGTTKQLL
jgi:hypothetical protein